MSVVITDYFTHVEFVYTAQAIPATISIGDLLPGGALDRTHLEMRTRKVPGLWAPWTVVPSWNQDTRVVGVIGHPVDHNSIQLRRKTPRDELWATPLRPEQRVDEENLRVNANQGFMMAYEFAAELGLNPRTSLLAPDYTEGVGIKSYTQQHYPSTFDFSKREYNFQFAGGYMSRSHVKVQIQRAGVWSELAINAAHWDSVNSSIYKFAGPWTLNLQLPDPSTITGLVIHRHTPRDIAVEYLLDGTGIVAEGMEPSATHALFVATELGEELSKVVPCDCFTYYTSGMFPLVIIDDFSTMSAPKESGGYLFGVPDDTFATGIAVPLAGGTLSPILNFVDYLNWRDVPGANDTFATGTPVPRPGGTLIPQTNPVSYLNWRDVSAANDTFATGIPVPQTGTLTVTIAYINYLNWRDVSGANDTFATGIPVPQNGTLV